MNGVGLIASILLAIFFVWFTCLKISMVAQRLLEWAIVRPAGN